jgi:hypothetical protein
MVRLIHVLGLQRSGTNYVVELARSNLRCETLTTGDRTICWKHALPDETGPNASHTGLSAGEAVLRRNDLLIVLVAKHPFQWVSSVTKRNAQDIFLKRKQLLVEDKPSILKMMQLYSAFYRSWLNLLSSENESKYIFVRYEDALLNPQQTVSRIGDYAEASPVAETRLPERVPFNRAFSQSDRARYEQFAHGLEGETISEIMASWDDRLMKTMGYAFPMSTADLSNTRERAFPGAAV